MTMSTGCQQKLAAFIDMIEDETSSFFAVIF